jgi:hypothetical protein
MEARFRDPSAYQLVTEWRRDRDDRPQAPEGTELEELVDTVLEITAGETMNGRDRGEPGPCRGGPGDDVRAIPMGVDDVGSPLPDQLHHQTALPRVGALPGTNGIDLNARGLHLAEECRPLAWAEDRRESDGVPTAAESRYETGNDRLEPSSGAGCGDM